MVQPVDSPVGEVPVIESEFDLSDSLARLDPIPSLGQDTGSILEELGYTPDEIEKLKSEGVVEGV